MNISTARQHIMNAVTAGVICGIITLIVTLISIMGAKILDFDVWNLFDVALIFGLTYGIYKNSRVCATLMLIYYMIDKIYAAFTLSKTPSLLSILFIYYFFQGMRATFAYHRLLQQKA